MKDPQYADTAGRWLWFRRFAGVSYKCLLLLISFSVISCGRQNAYDAAVTSGIATLPWPKQMEVMFGEGDHFVTHFGFDSKPKQWNTEVYFGKRYMLTLQVDVVINYSAGTVVKTASPATFYLTKIARIQRLPDGRMSTFPGNGWTVNEEQWSQLVAANGDWSVLGISLRMDDPVPGFDGYVKAHRSPRVRVK